MPKKPVFDGRNFLPCAWNSRGSPNDNSHAKKLAKLEKEVAALKAQLAKAGKPSGFVLLDKNGRLPQNLLVAGYDKHSLYDLGWQSLHMAAAAACRGSTRSGGSGGTQNAVLVRNTADKKTCTQLCAQTLFRNCDAEVSIHGKTGKATKNGEKIGAFYNYRCYNAVNGGSEVSRLVTDITRFPDPYPYYSFCCCRH
ncbi:hypothetical protein ACROYT_G018877 [Oculina patagonica]